MLPAPRDNRLVAALVGATAVAVGIANISGLAISDDGVAYRAIADSLESGEGLGYFLEPALTTWPPLFPLLMAAVMRVTPLGAEGAAVVLNIITAMVLVIGTDALLRRTVSSAQVRMAVAMSVAIGAPTVLFGHLLTTDFAMAAAVVWMAVALMDHRRTQQPSSLGWAMVSLWVGFGFRYAMVALIPLAAAWLLMQTQVPRVRRVGAAAGLGAAAGIVPLIWALRNHNVDGTYLGERFGSNRGLLGNAIDLGGAVGNLVAPGLAIELRLVWFGVAAIVVGAAAVLGARVVLTDERSRSFSGIVSLKATNTGLLVIITSGYLVYLLLARTMTAFDRLNFRFVYPVAIPMIVIAAVAIDHLLRREDTDRRWALAARGILATWVVGTSMLGVAMMLWFATGPDLFGGNYERQLYADIRNDDALDDPALTDCQISSNRPSGLYPELAAEWSPRDTAHFSSDPLDEIDDFATEAATVRTCLIWVDAEPEFANLMTLEEIEAEVSLTEIGRSGDVTIFEVTAP